MCKAPLYELVATVTEVALLNALQDEIGSIMQVGSVSRFLGQATNNEAEYTALILGLTAAHALGVHRLRVLGDSKLVVEQARSCSSSGQLALVMWPMIIKPRRCADTQVAGRWRCEKPNLQPLKQQAVSLQAGFVSCTLEHVLRWAGRLSDGLTCGLAC